MKEWIDAFLKRPVIAHVVRAATRYGERNGPLMAAAVTYFSVLSLVPILMFLFSMAGLVITLLLPDLLQSIRESMLGALGEGALKDFIEPILNRFLGSFGSASLIALGIALWSGTAWLGNLRKAVQFQLSDDAFAAPKHNAIVAILIDMGNFVVFVLITIATFASTVIATSFNKQLLGWLGLADTGWSSFLVGIVGLAVSVVAATVLFLYLFWTLAGNKLPRREWILGSLMAGVGLLVLQSLAGLITRMFSGNMSAQIFGPLIVIMLFFNLYATLIMFTAAWIGTSKVPEPVVEEDPVVVVAAPAPVRGPVPERATGRLIGTEPTLADVPVPDPDILVPQDVAARGVRVGAAVGYGLGAATGLGLGTLVASLARGLLRKR